MHTPQEPRPFFPQTPPDLILIATVILHTYIERMDTPETPDLCYGLAQRRAARHLARLYDHHISKAGLTSSQFSILAHLHHAPNLTVAALAHLLVMERTTLVRALKPLQTSGWINTQPPARGRAMELSLTPSGLAKTSEAAPLWKAAQKAFETEFGRDRAIALRNNLQTIGQAPKGATT